MRSDGSWKHPGEVIQMARKMCSLCLSDSPVEETVGSQGNPNWVFLGVRWNPLGCAYMKAPWHPRNCAQKQTWTISFQISYVFSMGDTVMSEKS